MKSTPPAPPDQMDPQVLANQVGQHMADRDTAGKLLGIRLRGIHPGGAEVEMSIRPDMLNGHGTCHGGITYTLADTAFAYACNSRNQKSVALTCTITYTAPGRLGDHLTATALERSLKGRVGLYDITLVNQNGECIAVFMGHAYRTRDPVIPVQ